jgi:HAMP domain
MEKANETRSKPSHGLVIGFDIVNILPHIQPTSPASEKTETFLTKLARRDAAASTQNRAFNELVFFTQHYRIVIIVEPSSWDGGWRWRHQELTKQCRALKYAQPGLCAYERHAVKAAHMKKEPMKEEVAEVTLYYRIPSTLAALVRKALAPLDTLTRAAERINADNLREHLPRTGNGDEVDRLSEVLNAIKPAAFFQRYAGSVERNDTLSFDFLAVGSCVMEHRGEEQVR